MSGANGKEARTRMLYMRTSLKKLLAAYPQPLLGKQIFGDDYTATGWRYAAFKRLINDGLVKAAKYGNTSFAYTASFDKLEPVVVDDDKLAAVMWPGAARLKQGLESLRETVGAQLETADVKPDESIEKVASEDTQTALTLPPPPPVENMRRPPEGASPEAIQEWIFTMLHAQTENLIYIREQVDKLLGQLL